MQLTPADVARFPRPGTAIPGRLAFSPDGGSLSFLAPAGAGLARELFGLELQSGERRRLLGLDEVGGGATDANISPEEALRRERERLRETGITHYRWAARAPVLLVPVRGALFVGRTNQIRKVAEETVAAAISDNGRRVVFVRGGELWTVPARGGKERRLTRDAAPGLTNGLAEYVAAEEMGRSEGLWISPDGAWVAFAQVDVRHIPELSIPHLARAPGAAELHRYPFAGAENARVRLGVVRTRGGQVRWLELEPYEYLCRVDWAGEALLVQVQPRDQHSLRLLRVEPASGSCALLREERTEPWINLHNDLRSLPGGGLLWSSEESGHRQLYRLDEDGSVQTQLTNAEEPVDRVVAVAGEQVWFLAAANGGLERHLFRVPLEGGQAERLTEGAGLHDAVVSPDGRWWATTSDTRFQPPEIRLHGPRPQILHAAAALPELPPPELLQIPARDGSLLDAALYLPDGPGPHPLVVDVYGGPHAQRVAEGWSLTVDLRSQHLRQEGFAVLKLDNRGAARRGLAFEGALHLRMGSIEVSDQADGVRHLVSLGIVDPKRVGISGWSYGGYLALMCLFQAPEVFRAAVSGAPVTEWEGYDTHYTERYMGTPADNPEGYHQGSVLTHLRPAGALLLVHGLIDENVHFRHSARLIDAMVKARIPHELLLFPDERHMPRSEKDRAMLEERLLGFFVRELGPRGDGNL